MLRDAYLKGLRDHRRALLFWSFAIAVHALLMALLFPSIREGAADMQSYITSMPEAVRNAFMGESTDFTQPMTFLDAELFSLNDPSSAAGLRHRPRRSADRRRGEGRQPESAGRPPPLAPEAARTEAWRPLHAHRRGHRRPPRGAGPGRARHRHAAHRRGTGRGARQPHPARRRVRRRRLRRCHRAATPAAPGAPGHGLPLARAPSSRRSFSDGRRAPGRAEGAARRRRPALPSRRRRRRRRARRCRPGGSQPAACRRCR